jgi:hypothetical protein
VVKGIGQRSACVNCRERHLRDIAEIAAAERINESYVGRVLRLTLLAPDPVEAILDGQQSAEMTLAEFMRPFPMLWEAQADPNIVRLTGAAAQLPNSGDDQGGKK